MISGDMMKKYILFILIIFLSGCSVNYNLSIDKGFYSEELTMNESDMSLFSSYNLSGVFERYDKAPIPKYNEYADYDYNKLKLLDSNLLYEKKNVLNDDGIFFSIYGRSMENKNINNSYLMNEFGNIEYSSDKGIYKFKYRLNDDVFTIYNMVDEISVNISDKNHYIINNNADSIKGNVYTWKLNNGNDKVISFDYKINTKKKSSKKDDVIYFPIFLVVIILFVVVFFFIIRFISNKRNSI